MSRSSFHAISTTTTAQLTWNLHQLQSVSTLTLYHTNSQSVAHVFHPSSSEMKTRYTMKGLQPGTNFKVDVKVASFFTNPELSLKQKLHISLETGIFYPPSLFEPRDDNLSCRTERRFGFVVWCLLLAQCPHDWLANGRSCYSVRRSALSWRDAQRSCTGLTARGHLADLKTPEDLLFVSSHLLTEDNLLLLWTGLNDQQVIKKTFKWLDSPNI